VYDFPATLDYLIAALEDDTDQTAKALVAFLGVCRRWAAPGSVGLLNLCDLAEAGTDAVRRVLRLLEQFKQTAN
jgi:hypothetical protein